MRFLFGRYHRPKRESRVFIFLDLADSTQLAEQLGDLEVQSLISRFFFDIAQPVNRHRGETHRYIGDEVVITWPLEKAIENARCIRCVLDIQTTMQKRADWYQRKFGLVPRFRIGMHGGPIVASEIGDHKREIVYFGDTINTAARLCSACKELGTDILISQSLTEQITLPGQTTISEGRKIHLAGKSEPVEVVSITNTQ